jgi:hypothetical protein
MTSRGKNVGISLGQARDKLRAGQSSFNAFHKRAFFEKVSATGKTVATRKSHQTPESHNPFSCFLPCLNFSGLLHELALVEKNWCFSNF